MKRRRTMKRLFTPIVGILVILVLSGLGFVSATQAESDPVFPYYVELAANINPHGSSNPAWFTEVNGELYFQAQDDEHGIELWKYSPITGEAALAADIYKGSGSSKPEWLTVYGSSIYFAATNPSLGRQIWRYNTGSGVAEVVALHEYWKTAGPPTGPDPKWLQFMGPVLFYNAEIRMDRGNELYAYDVRDGRSWLVKDILLGADDSDPRYLFVYGSRLYFTAKDEAHGIELWRSDGTEAGTFIVKDILAGPRSSDPSSFNILGEMFVFSADDWVHGRELWRSFGSGATTSLIKDIYQGSENSNPGWSNRLANSMVFFPANTEEHGNELWRYDPQYGAGLLADINIGKDDSDPAAIGDLGWAMFFSADDGESGVELWKSEPPYSYAIQVEDINPGKDDSSPNPLGKFGTTLFFTADDGQHGEEVWVSEFPYTRAFLLEDIRAGASGSIPRYTLGNFVGSLSNSYRMGWTIYFTANDGKHGVELWQISMGALPQTGFAPNVVTSLPPQPEEIAYQDLGDMRLEIPELNLDASIVGAPKVGNSWSLDWLTSNEVGYLTGTAFPTWEGNTVLSGHVYLSDGSPGPFANLSSLAYDDEIVIHAWGQDYVYHVREIYDWLTPNETSILEHRDRDWLTLITCKGFDETNGFYHWRTAIQAVLVEIR